MATHSNILTWKIPWTGQISPLLRSLVGYSPWGRRESDRIRGDVCRELVVCPFLLVPFLCLFPGRELWPSLCCSSCCGPSVQPHVPQRFAKWADPGNHNGFSCGCLKLCSLPEAGLYFFFIPASIFHSNFYWLLVALQCCVHFCHMAKWTSYMYTHIPSLLDFPSI